LANGSKSNESSLKADSDITDEFEVSESQSLPEDESEYESAEER